MSSGVHGRGCVGDVTHAIGWTATERRYVEGERSRLYVEGEGAIM
jgi:hypothetical protein